MSNTIKSTLLYLSYSDKQKAWRNYKGVFENLNYLSSKTLQIITINTWQFYIYWLPMWRKCRVAAGGQRTLWTFRHRASA